MREDTITNITAYHMNYLSSGFLRNGDSHKTVVIILYQKKTMFMVINVMADFFYSFHKVENIYRHITRSKFHSLDCV